MVIFLTTFRHTLILSEIVFQDRQYLNMIDIRSNHHDQKCVHDVFVILLLTSSLPKYSSNKRQNCFKHSCDKMLVICASIFSKDVNAQWYSTCSKRCFCMLLVKVKWTKSHFLTENCMPQPNGRTRRQHHLS